MKMNKTENQSEVVRPTYEPPRLDVISLRGDEVLAGSCKDVTGAGPTLTCQDNFGGSCSSLGS